MHSHGRHGPTVGVEEEYQLLCPDSLALVPAYDRLIDHCPPGDIEIKSELHQSCCEVVTKPCGSIAELDEAIRMQRRRLIEIAQAADLKIALSGTHPFSNWFDLPITQESRRLKSEFLFQEAHRQCLAYALHIHVEVPNREIGVRVMNDARQLLPLIYGLSASSPFLEGRLTGLNSSRLLRAFGFPRTGIPDSFESLEAYENLIQTLQNSGLIVDAGQVWWDIRAHHKYPTVEFRICDAVPRADDVAAIAALCQAYVAYLLDLYGRGKSVDWVNRLILEENRWRAARFGSDVELLDPQTNRFQPLHLLMEGLREKLSPFAKALGTEKHLDRAVEIARNGSASKRQLAAWNGRDKNLKAVVDLYQRETVAL